MMEEEQRSPNRVVASELSLSEAHLDFLGRSLVHLAHDLKNHLATINESAGLIGDLLKLKQRKHSGWARRFFKRGQGPPLNIDPFLKELNTIQEEVVQGSALFQDLGNLAQRLEKNPSLFMGNEASALKEMRKVITK
jgi:hypothetical protein